MPGSDRRAQLERERARVLDQIASLTMVFQGIVDSAELVATDDEHDPEGHTIAYERQQVAALIRDARTRLDELEQALVRVDAGSYGVCTSCGAKIPAERLNARPGAHTCVDCAW
ncbi:MAG TPA: TraR/DksA C4-type zinc finger protein [Acidimicrobiales bacterium]